MQINEVSWVNINTQQFTHRWSHSNWIFGWNNSHECVGNCCLLVKLRYWGAWLAASASLGQAQDQRQTIGLDFLRICFEINSSGSHRGFTSVCDWWAVAVDDPLDQRTMLHTQWPTGTDEISTNWHLRGKMLMNGLNNIFRTNKNIMWTGMLPL